MPFWIVVDIEGKHRGLMGPYSESKAESVEDELASPDAKKYETESGNRKEAGREIREQRMREISPKEGFKNFSHKVKG